MLSPVLFDGNFRVAVSAQNIMGSLRLDKEDSPLPLIVRFGTLTKVGKHLNITADLVASRDDLPFIAAGAELKISPAKAMDIFLRAGANTRAVSDLGGTHNVALGGGLRLGSYTMDYAFSPIGDLGTVHRISISISH